MSQPPPNKRRKSSENIEVGSPLESESKFLSISDDVLLLIFRNLPSSDLLSVADTCTRLHQVCQDRTLWRNAEFTPMDIKTLKKCLKQLHNKTESLGLEGYLLTKGKITNLSEAALIEIGKICETLTTFKLHNFFIHGDKINFDHFPKTLRHLSLKGCEIDNLPSNKSYFKNIHKQLPYIETLSLEKCGWVKNHCLMAICKLEHLATR